MRTLFYLMATFFVSLQLIGCSQKGIKGVEKHYILDQMTVTIKAPSGWQEDYNTEYEYVSFSKSPETVIEVSFFCTTCDKKNYKENQDRRLKDKFLSLEGGRYKKSEEPQPGQHVFVLEGITSAGVQSFLSGVYHVKEGISGVLACEAKVETKDVNLIGGIEKICKGVKITPLK